MLKKYSLNQFSEAQLDNWGANIRFGYLSTDRIFAFQLAIYFIGSIFLWGILNSQKMGVKNDWKDILFISYTVVLFLYMAVITIFYELQRKKGKESLLIEVLQTTVMGFGTMFTVIFMFGSACLLYRTEIIENYMGGFQKPFLERVLEFFQIFSDLLFILLLVTIFLGYYFDIVRRTKNNKVKKLEFKDYLKGKAIPKYAGIGAAIGWIISAIFIDIEFIMNTFLLFLSFGLAYFLPRTFMPVYLKTRFPETFCERKSVQSKKKRRK